MIIEVDDWEDWEHVNLSGFTNTILTVHDAELVKQMEERKLEERKLVEESDQILVHELFEEASTTQPVKMPIIIPFTTIAPIKSPTSAEMTAKNAKKSNYRLEHELKQKAHAKKVIEFAIKQKKVAEIYGKASEIDKYDEYDAKFY